MRGRPCRAGTQASPGSARRCAKDHASLCGALAVQVFDEVRATVPKMILDDGELGLLLVGCFVTPPMSEGRKPWCLLGC